MRPINTFCAQSEDLMDVKAGRTCSKHCALKSYDVVYFCYLFIIALTARSYRDWYIGSTVNRRNYVNVGGPRTNIDALSGIQTYNPMDEPSRASPQTARPPNRQDIGVNTVQNKNADLEKFRSDASSATWPNRIFVLFFSFAHEDGSKIQFPKRCNFKIF
jgi:hypothetical protein